MQVCLETEMNYKRVKQQVKWSGG